MVRRFGTALALLATIALTTGAHRQIPAVPHTQQDDAFVPRPEVAKAMALGFDAVLADYYWVQAVLLAGGNARPSLHATHLGRLIDVMTGEQICEELQMDYNERDLKYWRQRRGLPSFCLWVNGEEHRRYARAAFDEWLLSGACKGEVNG